MDARKPVRVVEKYEEQYSGCCRCLHCYFARSSLLPEAMWLLGGLPVLRIGRVCEGEEGGI